jgi:signal transduction histidine kinase
LTGGRLPLSESPSRTQLQAEIEILQMRLRESQQQLTEALKLQQAGTSTVRDLMTALAENANLDRGIQAVLINLQELVPYDLAGLFLLARRNPVLSRMVRSTQSTIRFLADDHPLVIAMENSTEPLILVDTQADPRFKDWEEMQPIRSWMGVPLKVNTEMVGFLSLGSLQPDVYSVENGQYVKDFILPVNALIERILTPELPVRIAGRLDVISRLTLALGQVESREETFRTILQQVGRIFGAAEGIFLFPDSQSATLVVNFSLNEHLQGISHPRQADIIWDAFDKRQIIFLEDAQAYAVEHPQRLFQEVFSGRLSVLVVPLSVENAAFAILLVTFDQVVLLSSDELLLAEALAQMTSTTLHRLLTLEGLEKQLSEERSRLIEQTEQAAVTEERQRLARELHDSVTQLIYSQVLFAGAGLKVLRSGDVSLSEEYLQRIHIVAQQALKEMRLLVFELRPNEGLEDGLVSALQHRLDAVERRSDLQVKFEVQGALELDENTEIALYYIAMEALNNVLKHSGATIINFSIQAGSEGLLMEIRDNGCGFDSSRDQQRGGMGLTSMQERISAVGGEIEMRSSPGEGTHLIVRIQENQ